MPNLLIVFFSGISFPSSFQQLPNLTELSELIFFYCSGMIDLSGLYGLESLIIRSSSSDNVNEEEHTGKFIEKGFDDLSLLRSLRITGRIFKPNIIYNFISKSNSIKKLSLSSTNISLSGFVGVNNSIISLTISDDMTPPIKVFQLKEEEEERQEGQNLFPNLQELCISDSVLSKKLSFHHPLNDVNLEI